MKVSVGVLAALLIAVGCGKAERGDDDGAGAGAMSGSGRAGSGGSTIGTGGSGGASAAGRSAGASGGGGGSPAGGSATAGAPPSGGASMVGGGSGTGGAGNAGGSRASGGESGAGDSGAPSGGTGGAKSLAMLVMFDRSWSMNECADGSGPADATVCMTGPSRWAVTSSALLQFFQDPALAGVSVALRFFPDDHPAVGCDGYPPGVSNGFGGQAFGGAAGMAGAVGSAGGGMAGAAANCSAEACAVPLVEAAALTSEPAPTDAQEQAFVDEIAASSPPPDMPNPNPQTPTSAAVGGAEQWATKYLGAHQGSAVVVVIVTDGEPAGCDTNITNIARLANDAGKQGVLTYVIGLSGSNEEVLNTIASAGGTTRAFLVADGSSTTADLVAALNQIRAGSQ